ncbi:MAG: tRNA uridine-5-carboxymethylaminomethyl(34) synthesis GTPase MnmE [candidate division KSB1 bacterium]|nr:tRNA uridine-5-carboxymethylaminomethyl(34) synthesis GTPase MnmE [candidate division KSB1 bacterium]MDZ7346086.1 tRNA uridine-5-carboxymethylaminomethyl(34) synthesis GTPase MnmE [candidate division KSB1 bacterium]
MKNDTIAAIATPPGIGAISIIRVSGPSSIDKIASVFRASKSLIEAEERRMLYGKIIDPRDKQEIDRVLVVKFIAPHSYTGEDMVEIHCHGSRLITSEIMRILVESGIRPACPGEYSLRAFLNGKIDLVQAEAVADVIQAQTKAALKASQRQLEGELSKHLNAIKNDLKDTVALLELSLDFSEEDITFIQANDLKTRIEKSLESIKSLLKGFRYGKILREGLIVVLTGKPNVGKSSILNKLLQKERAIVSDIPGTTRDSIEEWIDINGYLIRIIDTAGIWGAQGVLEQKAKDRTLKAVQNADLVLFITDGSSELDSEDLQALKQIEEKYNGTIILIRNKADLGLAALNERILQKFDGALVISAKTGEGFENLEKRILAQIAELPHEDEIICNDRHYEELLKAKSELENALEALERSLSEEFLAVHLKGALSCLGRITGEVTVDEILDHIFSRFCIGK